MSVYTGRVDGTISIVEHETIAQAETWIAKQERLDPEGVKSGAYYIDAPEGALTQAGERLPARPVDSKRVNRAIQTARECATADPGLADVKLRRFHRAMDALQPGEGEAVYDVLRREGWYALAAEALNAGRQA